MYFETFMKTRHVSRRLYNGQYQCPVLFVALIYSELSFAQRINVDREIMSFKHPIIKSKKLINSFHDSHTTYITGFEELIKYNIHVYAKSLITN